MTDSDGEYRFEDAPSGSYLVWEAVPDGFEQTAPASFFTAVDLDGSTTIENVDFGNQAFVFPTGTGEITGFKWEDINANGVQDGLEEGLAGFTVFLDLNQNAQLDPNEPTQVTDASGNYRFIELAAGTYDVREVQQPGFVQTVPLGEEATLEDGSTVIVPGFHTVTLAADEIAANIDFANKAFTGEIRGLKWEDANGNGIQEANEATLEGVTIYLDLDNDNQFDPNEPSALTDANGQYRFRDLAAGTYTVREVVPLNFVSTFPVEAEYTITLALGEVVEDIDFGNQRLIQTVANRPPEFTSAPVTEGTEGVDYDYQPTVTDPDGDPLTFTLIEGPLGLSLESATGLLLWTPTSDQVGDADVIIQVSDDEGLTDTQAFTINVQDRSLNTPPIFISDPGHRLCCVCS